MESKVCGKCKVEKKLSDYHKNRCKPDGLRAYCKDCAIQYRKNHYEKNRERLLKEKKEYGEKNRDKLISKNRRYWQENRDRLVKQKRDHYKENRERLLNEKRERYQLEKEIVSERGKRYRAKNISKIREYRRTKYNNDGLHRLRCNLTTRTAMAFNQKGYTKRTRTYKILGADWLIVKKHIERQFTKGMNWDNYGEWHIDHIIPLSKAKTQDELIKLCHYRNLQPLWYKDNLSKGAKIIEPVQTYLPI